ncbi:alginate lyase family protein [Streptomyces sp. LP11]|uniref:Alginate lyase family protein n=1 Tax=Streptomyces pyxinicus TaxID=2970331 RepID=A0ABT2B7U9_9ACTN|nr:alginate lyase family protein [Streptomyces sp. LP11]MCS0604603.1 alginate lyase family protein [Streptomyces sp. LP11]
MTSRRVHGPYLPSPAAHSAPASFVHPGVTVSRSRLDFARDKVLAGAQPWKSAWDRMTASEYADLNRTPKPRATVECGSYSDPNHGCTGEREDAIAAYTDAVAWYVTKDARYAQKAIQLMDAWSATITGHTNSNAPLQTGWAGSSWPKAAEIITYTYTGGWANQNRFATMLRNVYPPVVIKGSHSNGNWAVRIQGQDLYGTDVGERLRQALGFQARYQRGETVPGRLCGGSLTLGLGPVTEVGYNALHYRLGTAMTDTEALTLQQRPAGGDNLFVAWETLTHGDNPD